MIDSDVRLWRYCSSAGFILASFWLVQPFLTPFVWATTIVVATCPLLLGLLKRLWGKCRLAVAVMTVVLLLVLVVPISLAVFTMGDKAHEIVAWVKSLASFTVPPPPQRICLRGLRLTPATAVLTAVMVMLCVSLPVSSAA